MRPAPVAGHRLVEAEPRLTEREIEGCSLERPAADSSARPRIPGLARIDHVTPARARTLGSSRRTATALGARREQVVLLERDLLAVAVLAAAFEVDDRRRAMRPHHARDRLVLDRERKVVPAAPQHVSRSQGEARTEPSSVHQPVGRRPASASSASMPSRRNLLLTSTRRRSPSASSNSTSSSAMWTVCASTALNPMSIHSCSASQNASNANRSWTKSAPRSRFAAVRPFRTNCSVTPASRCTRAR